jgi:AraC-like DNA-binding protein
MSISSTVVDRADIRFHAAVAALQPYVGSFWVITAERGATVRVDIAVRCGASERNLGRLMRDWIGYGPKRYAGIVRFQSTLAQMERAPQLPVAMLATQIGYFDQSHLTVEMARYAGATPSRLISEHVSDFSKTRCDVPF